MDRVIILQYITWHFIEAPYGIILAWKNFLKFGLEYFSIPTLLKTFFSPWHRYHMAYGGWSAWQWFETFTFNMMSRIIGAMLRAFFIVVGIFTEILIFFGGIAAILAWIALPILIIIFLTSGIGFIVRSIV